MDKVCLVTGVGPDKGTGSEIARYFSENGYMVAMLARSSKNLQFLEEKYPNTKGFCCDVGKIDHLKNTINKVQSELGDPDIVIHNAPSATRGPILDLDYEDLEKNFRVNVTALFVLVQNTVAQMINKGSGSIMVTGNTAATRGKANWGFFASTKAAQRILAESLAREFGPKGIHVAYFVIDALINTPRTRPYLAPDMEDSFFSEPFAIAKEIFNVAHQHKSAWSFLVELRPFGEKW